MSAPTLVILGASTRAAAFSALRGGFRPWCADLFGDVDLRQSCPVTILPGTDYPHGFLKVIEQAPAGPWMYTGALENRPRLLAALAQRRPLWGNEPTALAVVRSPSRRTALFQEAGVRCPAVTAPAQALASDRRWLLKPRASAGGAAIQFWDRCPLPPAKARRFYLQEFIAGEPYSALFVGAGQHATLLGVTRQLIGLDWSHAHPFQYCGSIGPCPLAPSFRQKLELLGHALARAAGLRGLFGVDYILHDDELWPVEINPRYTASVEILEHTLGIHALALHGYCFDATVPDPPSSITSKPTVLGKAILFARDDLRIPPTAPWHAAASAWQTVPAFADIPAPGQVIARGRPILTLFATADSIAGCEGALRQRVSDLDRSLFGR